MRAAPCNCCSTVRQYVLEHLNWDLTIVDAGHWEPADYWEAACECVDFWRAHGEPVELTTAELAELFQELYGKGKA